MPSNKELLEERKRRVATAIALEKPDRVPVVPLGNAFAAGVVGVKMSDFCADPVVAYKTMIKAFSSLGDIDGVQQEGYSPHLLSVLWNSRVKIPGRELPKDSLWQVQELELMTVADYDTIIDKGYAAFLESFYRDKLDDPLAKLAPYFASVPGAIQEWAEVGIPVISPGLATIPYEGFCGGRSLRAFIMDLHRIPDKVQAAMDVASEYLIQQARELIRANRPMAIWVGGWRAASQFVAPRLWERFVWPYYKKLVAAVVEEGAVAILHFDSDWTRDLAYLRELPKAKCVLATDGSTNLYKAKEVLGNHMCLMGDVHSRMLMIADPDEVYAYASRLVRDLGPAGFILSSGCDIPFGAKVENVKAMVAAVH